MDNVEFASKLQDIADNLEKIAATAEADVKLETEKIAAVKETEKLAEFSFGEIGSKPLAGSNPLLDFCLS